MQITVNGATRAHEGHGIANKRVPIVVDLDGTLLHTDMLLETATSFITKSPANVLRLLIWLARGRPYLKGELVKHTSVDVATLPYNHTIIDWLKEKRSQGHVLVLATASHRLLADSIAQHSGLFDDVMATDSYTNLKSHHKRDALIGKFGYGGFEYVGNSWADIPVMAASAGGYLVCPSRRLLKRATAVTVVREIFERPRGGISAFLRAIRLGQWIKNFLVFVPLLAAHRYSDVSAVGNGVAAFLCFCFAASSAYLLNDLADIEHDRQHRYKKGRPFASGALSILTGWLLAPVLLAVSLSIAFLILPLSFIATLGAYYAGTLIYSAALKRVVLLDVLALATLYSLRLVGGAEAVSAPLSFWLLTFSMFIFLSLALAKRYSELCADHGQSTKLRGRGYFSTDSSMVAVMGASAGYLSVLVLALYVQDSGTILLYESPKFIWLACPLTLYWISRVWMTAHRGQLNEDPVVFAAKDKHSVVIGCLLFTLFLLARWT